MVNDALQAIPSRSAQLMRAERTRWLLGICMAGMALEQSYWEVVRPLRFHLPTTWGIFILVLIAIAMTASIGLLRRRVSGFMAFYTAAAIGTFIGRVQIPFVESLAELLPLGGYGWVFALAGLVINPLLIVLAIRTHKVLCREGNLPIVQLPGPGLVWAALGLGVMANGLEVVLVLPLAQVPAGTPIRPMGMVCGMFAMALFALVVVLPLGICSALKKPSRGLAIVAIILGMTPLPVGIAVLSALVHVCKLTLEP